MIRVACAIIFYRDKILVTQRGPDMKQPCKWEFPGGKVEQGETDDDCILRELQEELHISVDITGKLRECSYDYGDFQIVLIPFTANFISGTIVLAEHMNYAWLSPAELRTLDWAPADVEVMEMFLNQ